MRVSTGLQNGGADRRWGQKFSESVPHLSAGGVDADGAAQLLLGHAALHGRSVALRYLAGVGAQVVEPDHAVLRGRGREAYKPLALERMHVVPHARKRSHEL